MIIYTHLSCVSNVVMNLILNLRGSTMCFVDDNCYGASNSGCVPNIDRLMDRLSYTHNLLGQKMHAGKIPSMRNSCSRVVFTGEISNFLLKTVRLLDRSNRGNPDVHSNDGIARAGAHLTVSVIIHLYSPTL